MTTETEVKKEEKVKPIWSAEEKENSKVIYGTAIVVENGSYEEGWGSNYWLRIIRDELIENLENHE